MNTWQPIEQAPKDGTVIDLWCNGERYTDMFWSNEYDRWSHGTGAYAFFKPTHFMRITGPGEEQDCVEDPSDAIVVAVKRVLNWQCALHESLVDVVARRTVTELRAAVGGKLLRLPEYQSPMDGGELIAAAHGKGAGK